MTKKRIYLAIVLLWLGSLACFMQTQPAPRAATHLPPREAAPAAEPIATASGSLDCTVNTHALNVRDCAGLQCSAIGWLEYGWIVKAERSSGSARWLKITRGNLTGFARADYLTCNFGE